MPIHARYRWFYPIDWPQLSAVIRFKRAQGKCEGCGRPHGHTVCHLGDGRWWDRDRKQWRDGKGRPLPRLPALWLWKGTVRTTRVVLACSHLDHDPTNNRPSNLKALLPALPHAARPAGASAPALVHAVPAQSTRRPLSGSVSVADGERPLLSQINDIFTME